MSNTIISKQESNGTAKQPKTMETGLLQSDSSRYFDGYTLFTTTDEEDVYLVDMEGKLIHVWPTRSSNLAELKPNGNLVYGSNYRGVEELDWEGNTVWYYTCDYHHDFAITGPNSIMILAGGRHRDFSRPDVFEGCAEGLSFLADYCIEIDTRTFSRKWQWWSHEHIKELQEIGIPFPRPVDIHSKGRWGDIFHCNTLDVLPDTELGRRDPRFRAGNMMFSYRQLSTIGIVDRDTGDIVWIWGPGELDGQHQPEMIPEIDPLTGQRMEGAGNILVFDNGRYERDYSRVIEVNPVTNEIVWSSPENWYSWHISGAQRLANGNTFICDGPHGRLFEITPDGDTVWEYVNPYSAGGDSRRLAMKDRIVHDDVGGIDVLGNVYRAVRYPKAYVDKILANHEGRTDYYGYKKFAV